MAGQRFYEETLGLMFDANGILVCEPSLYTVQALCLLEMHEVNAQFAWTKALRYHGNFKIVSNNSRNQLFSQI